MKAIILEWPHNLKDFSTSLEMTRKTICLLFLFFNISFAYSQKKYILEIRSTKTEEKIDIPYLKSFSTKQDREKELRNYLLKLHDNAYLAATFDSIKTDSLNAIAYLTQGDIYKWAKLERGNVDEGVLSEVNFREKLYNNKPIYYKDVKKLQEKIIIYFENNGYPFASVKLDSISFSDNLLSAKLNLTKNLQVKIDSVEIKGSAKITRKYIYNYINVKPGSLYNESAISKTSKRLKELPFVKETKPAEILFSEKSSKIILYLDKKQASQFDGILGLLPDDNTGKLLFTGDVRLKLQNAVGYGEQLELNWRKLQANTQDLRTRVVYPYIFSTPFGIDYIFKLYKRDTTFIDVNQNIGLQYLLTGGDYFKVFVNTKKTSLLSTKSLQLQSSLPQNGDVSTTIYGIGYRTERLDYRLNPRKGFSLIVNAGAGNKKIKRNTSLNQEIYDTLKTLVSVQYNADIETAYFIPLQGLSTLKIGVQGAFLQNDNTFQNELFRFGGLRTLRGFDEESIMASAYGIFTAEYRYLLEQNSYMYLFFDQAYYEKRIIDSFVHDTPFGFGAGISFETKAGIFSINYALGKQFNNPIQFKSGKVHFGIVSYF